MGKKSKVKPADTKAKTDTPEPAASASADPRDFTLTRAEARAGGPADMSVTGEEDPGAGLEFLVKKNQP